MGVLEEQGRWTAKTLGEVAKGQRELIESHTVFKTRVNTQTTVISAFAALITSFFAEFFRR